MKVVLPIAAPLAILIAAGVFGGAKPNDGAPVDQAAAARAASVTARDAGYPVTFDPFTGWGAAALQHGAPDPGPEGPAVAQRALPLVEVDPFDRYGVGAPFEPLVRAVTGSWGRSLVNLRRSARSVRPRTRCRRSAPTPVAPATAAGGSRLRWMPSRRMTEVLIGAAALAAVAPLVWALARLALRPFPGCARRPGRKRCRRPSVAAGAGAHVRARSPCTSPAW